MPRPPDPSRRAAVLAAATDHVIEHGLAGLSLRPLAAALGSSTRMLLYDFGSKEALLSAVLEEARRRQVASLQAALTGQPTEPSHTPQAALRAAWRWFTEHPDYIRLLLEVQLDVIRHPESYRDRRELVDDWIRYITTTFGADQASATLVLAVLRGLAFDRLTAPDNQPIDQALETFTHLIETQQSG